MKKIQRLSAASRAEALAVGLYQTGTGTFVRLAELNDHHLVNALLKALAAEEGDDLTRPLADEVRRRGLAELALAVAAERTS